MKARFQLIAAFAVIFGLNGTVLASKDSSPDKHAAEAGHAANKGESKESHGSGKGQEGNEGHGEEETSDLDRAVKDLWAAQCEHKIPQFKCDECRYEIGVVKVPASILPESGKSGLVAVTEPKRVSFGSALSFPGEIALSEGKTFHATTPQSGVVRAVFADVGTVVKPGDPLFEIDSHDLAEAKGDLKKKVSARDLAKKNAERESRLFEKKISAEVEVQEAQARLADAEVDLSNARSRLVRLGVPESDIASFLESPTGGMSGLLTVRAAQGGTVLERHIAVGERVEPDKELLLLSDLTEVWGWATLREGDARTLSKLGKKGPIPAEVRASGGKTYRGHFDIVSGVMNEQTRTLKGRVVVSNPDGGLRPGMFVTIRILVPGGGSGLSVPKGAVLTDAGRSFVFIHKEGEFWIRRPVKTGRASGDSIEISKGISPGQKVVANGAFLLKSDVLRSKMGAGCAD
jgi:cobalt-zinc-cadmium efflux system membrane fusion protein